MMKRALIYLSVVYGLGASSNLNAQESSKSADAAALRSGSRVPALPARSPTFLNAQESLSPLMREVDRLLLAGKLDEAAKRIEEISEEISEESLANLRAHLSRELARKANPKAATKVLQNEAESFSYLIRKFVSARRRGD